MTSNKIFRIKVKVDNDIEQILCKMGTQQCTVIKFSNNDELVVYVNNYATETSAGLYMQHFGQLKDNADKIKRKVAVIAQQVNHLFYLIYLFYFRYENYREFFSFKK